MIDVVADQDLVTFDVKVTAMPVRVLDDVERSTLEGAIERAKTLALAMLRDEPDTLMLRLKMAIDRWDDLAKAEKTFAKAAVQSAPDFETHQAAYDAAQEGFEDAMNILINRFEREFPRGSH